MRLILLLCMVIFPQYGFGDDFSEFVEKMGGEIPAAHPYQQTRVVVLGVDGLPGDWVVNQISMHPESYPNLRRFFINGTWVKSSVPPLPSLSVTGWFTISGGQPPGGPYGHHISAFHWVNRQEGWYRDMISLQFLLKDKDYRKNGGESLFGDYPKHRTVAYGFYHSDYADNRFSAELHGGLELGLKVRPEPLEVNDWRRFKGGIDSDIKTTVERLIQVRASLRSIRKDISIERSGSARKKLLDAEREADLAVMEHKRVIRSSSKQLDKDWANLLLLHEEAKVVAPIQICGGENFTDEEFKDGHLVPIYNHRWPDSVYLADMSKRLEEFIATGFFFDERHHLIGDRIQAIRDMAEALDLFSKDFSPSSYDKARWNHLLRRYNNVMYVVCTSLEDKKFKLKRDITALLTNVRNRTFPVLTTFSSYTFDWLLHRHGVYSRENVMEVRNVVDPLLGDIFETIDLLDFDGPTYFLLISDHGAMTTKNVFFMSDILENRFSVKVKRLSSLEGESITANLLPNSNDVFGYDSLVASTGGGYVSLDMSILEDSYGGFFGGPVITEWARHPTYSDLRSFKLVNGETVDFIDILKNRIVDWPNIQKDGSPTFDKDYSKPQENVLDFFIVRDRPVSMDDSTVRVVSSRGEGLISRKSDLNGEFLYNYRVLEGDDPLWRGKDFVVASLIGTDLWWRDEVWREVTAKSERKDIINRLSHLFDFDRSGTVVFFIKDGWSGNALVHGRHGGALVTELNGTMALIGPDIPAGGKIQTARMEDIRRLLADIVGVTAVTRTDIMEREPLLPKFLNAPIEDYSPDIPWQGYEG